MKNMNLWKLSTLGLAIALGVVTFGQGVRPASADEQPLMVKALENLESAHKALENATADKGGHRVKALKLTKEAIDEVKKGIKFDNKNDNEKKDKDKSKE